MPMDENAFQPPPELLEAIIARTREIGFQSWCWPQVGALLRVMAALKPGGRLLEIGTGTGVGTCWLLDGMDADARLTTVDIDPKVQAIARSHLGTDPRLTVLCEDAGAVIRRQSPNSLDLIFADGGAGKYVLLDETLALLRPGGIYICDDMKPHPMWPPAHAAKVPPLMEKLAARRDFRRLYIDWSSGVVAMVKIGCVEAGAPCSICRSVSSG
jgi:predicted O-methyltransferase YrrM